MFAVQFASNEIFPLKKSDSAATARLFMDDWKVSELPVVEGGKVIGIVTETMLLDFTDEKVESIMDIHTELYLVPESLHVFEVLAKFDGNQTRTRALVSKDGFFTGIISAVDVTRQSFAHSALKQEGAIIVIEVQAIHYSLAEISRICEGNEAKIIHLMIEPIKDETNTLQVSIKLNKQFSSHVIASLERFGYRVIFSNGETDPNGTFEDRYRWLVKYLNS